MGHYNINRFKYTYTPDTRLRVSNISNLLYIDLQSELRKQCWLDFHYTLPAIAREMYNSYFSWKESRDYLSMWCGGGEL